MNESKDGISKVERSYDQRQISHDQTNLKIVARVSKMFELRDFHVHTILSDAAAVKSCGA